MLKRQEEMGKSMAGTIDTGRMETIFIRSSTFMCDSNK